MKGGYKLIDFKKVDITEEDVVIDGIFNSINSTTKRVVATNLNIGGYELKEVELSVVGSESEYLLQCPFFKIIITDEDGVSCVVFTNDNYSTKKIYCHPISIVRNSESVKFTLQLLILNNDDTPFTSATLKKWLDDLIIATESRVKLICSGATTKSGNIENMANEPIVASSFGKTLSNNYSIAGVNLTSSINDSLYSNNWDTLFPSSDITFTDGVNAIN